MTSDLQEDIALQHFVEQSLDKLNQIETLLIQMEKSNAPSAASVAQVYGVLFSLKESASLLELTNISLIADKIGKVLDQVYKNEIELSNDLLNIIIDSFDKLNEMVSNATLSNDYDIRIITLPLEMYSKPGTAAAAEQEKHEEEPLTAQVEPDVVPETKQKEESESEFKPAPKPEPKQEPVIETEEVQAQVASSKNGKRLKPATFRKRYGIKREIDLASNSNPLGTSKAVSNAITNMANNCSSSENDSTDSLKFGLAKRHDLPEECVLTAGGTIELLDLTLRLSAIPGVDHVLSYEHGRPEYSRVAALCGVELLRLPRGRNFSPPLDQLVKNSNQNTAAVIITNPDVPSGFGLPAEELATMANLLPERTLLIVDERSVEFAWPEDDYSMVNFLDKAPNLVILRSFSWSFGLKGVRLGYALLNSQRAEQFEESRLPAPISPLNVEAGLAAINHNEFYYSTIALIIRGRERVHKGLEELGCTVYPSQSNFIMFSAPIPASELYGKMLEHGFKLRRLDRFGLPDLLTVSIGNNSRNRTFLAAMKNIL
ncbi:aminotransferase class I/II-fold pyridoxal phosphate-dependent enzyme [Maridesulfovibrio sp.]|uniref:aminotransferase class I/II-fold pyridoxal phosphate-dependent enzyme n=1 Tax=Maridesulfovibrio sp. TaxID=2795000 RepID=UPI0029C9DAD1|nr:aminotransferase class I/II-fold pyridoxal phosphate-dependent enzyme [Maridesulfovibrio sp.]